MKILCLTDFPVKSPDRWLWNFVPDATDEIDFLWIQASDRSGRLGKIPARYPSFWELARQALRRCSTTSYDLVVAWESKTGMPYACLQWLRHTKSAPLIVLTFSAKQYTLGLKPLVSRWLKRVDHLTVPSQWEATYYRKVLNLSSTQISVCHLGAYDRQDQPSIGATMVNMPRGPRYVFSGGNTDRDYGTLFDSLAGLGVQTIVNTRPHVLRGLQVPDDIRINDLMTGADYAALMAQANVVVIPLRMVNHAAGLSMILDAMVYGRPVICSDVPALRDYVSNGVTGILVPPGDSNALREAVISLLSNPDRCEAMGRAARAHYEMQFTFSLFAQRVHTILRQVIESAASQEQ